MTPARTALVVLLCLSACKDKVSTPSPDCEARAQAFASYAADVAEDSLSTVNRMQLVATELEPVARPAKRQFGEVNIEKQGVHVGGMSEASASVKRPPVGRSSMVHTRRNVKNGSWFCTPVWESAATVSWTALRHTEPDVNAVAVHNGLRAVVRLVFEPAYDSSSDRALAISES